MLCVTAIKRDFGHVCIRILCCFLSLVCRKRGARSENEIFVCKARVVFGQDVVFFRTLSKNTKNRRGSGEGGGGKKDVLFF